MRKYRDGKAEVVEYKGIKFRRYPNSKNWADRNYYRPHSGHIRDGVETLHRELWKDNIGPIPDGYHVHHKDGDPTNNDLDNLDCVPGETHLEMHDGDTRSEEWWKKQLEHLDNIRPLAAEWHRSDEARPIQRKAAEKFWEQRKTTTKECEFCENEYETYFPSRSRFCSNNCASRSRYKRRLYFEERTCEYCGETWEVEKSQPSRFCSTSCVAKSRKRSDDGTFA